jgi:homoserine O-succinyltransferase
VRNNHREAGSATVYDGSTDAIRIALINNMPDSALEDTESQFFELLDAAAGPLPVRLKLYSLPKIPRSDRGNGHLNSFYFGLDDLWNSRFDGVIITGTEPHQPDLRKEPYWSALADILDWAEENTASTVLSCLAAHAGVLHSDGIGRHPLDTKKFGVFDDRKVSDHVLTSGTSEPMRFPHSRWNEVREDALTSCGYSVLTKSAEAGVNLFAKKKKKSLFVHFQGHPEYGAGTLLKEYRRDVKRFLRRERPTYPNLPHGYFDAEATKVLDKFRETALAHPHEELMAAFPEVVVCKGLESAWHSAAHRVYRNWLQYVVSRRASTAPYAASAASRISVTWSR